MLRQLWAATIWHRDAIPQAERKYRSLKRVWLPIVDVLFILSALAAFRYGVPAINEYFADDDVDRYAFVLGGSATLALVGVAFPRLWLLEVIGKCMIVGCLAGYVAALLLLTQAGDDGRGFVGGIALVAMMPPLIRLSILGTELADRRADLQAIRELNDEARDRDAER